MSTQQGLYDGASVDSSLVREWCGLMCIEIEKDMRAKIVAILMLGRLQMTFIEEDFKLEARTG